MKVHSVAMPLTAASTITVTVPVGPPVLVERTKAAVSTTSARASAARRNTRATPYRSTRVPAAANAASRGIHSRANAKPVSTGEPVVARTSSGIP